MTLSAAAASRRRFGIGVAIFAMLLFVLPIVAKRAGLLPVRWEGPPSKQGGRKPRPQMPAQTLPGTTENERLPSQPPRDGEASRARNQSDHQEVRKTDVDNDR